MKPTHPDDPTIQPPSRDLLHSLELTTRIPKSDLQSFRVDIRLGGSPQSVELETLLLQRLRILALILGGGHVFFNAFRLLRREFTPAFVAWTLSPALLNLVALVGLAISLWTMRPP